MYTNSSVGRQWVADVTDDITFRVVLRPDACHVHHSLHSTHILLYCETAGNSASGTIKLSNKNMAQYTEDGDPRFTVRARRGNNGNVTLKRRNTKTRYKEMRHILSHFHPCNTLLYFIMLRAVGGIIRYRDPSVRLSHGAAALGAQLS